MALGVGVELGGVGVPVVSLVGEAVVLPGDGDGETSALVVAVEDAAGEIVKLGAGDGLALPVAGVATVAADVGASGGVSDGSSTVGVAEGAGGVPVPKTGEADTSACEMPEAPSADEARGKWRNNKSPTSDRPPAGLNSRILTPSS